MNRYIKYGKTNRYMKKNYIIWERGSIQRIINRKETQETNSMMKRSQKWVKSVECLFTELKSPCKNMVYTQGKTDRGKRDHTFDDKQC